MRERGSAGFKRARVRRTCFFIKSAVVITVVGTRGRVFYEGHRDCLTFKRERGGRDQESGQDLRKQ